jgi:hypothetical protein
MDLGVGLRSSDHGGSRHVHFARFFDDPIKSCPDVSLTSFEQFRGVCVTIDACPDSDRIFSIKAIDSR